MMKHCHAARQLPVDAGSTEVFLSDKANGLAGLAGQRILHVCCPYWKSFFGKRIKIEAKSRAYTVPSYAHAHMPGRRREGAMISQSSVGQRLQKLGYQSLAHYRDLTNAFASTNDSARDSILSEIVEEPSDNFAGYYNWFEVRAKSPIVKIKCSDGEVELIPGKGFVVGTAEGPVLFQGAFCHHEQVA